MNRVPTPLCHTFHGFGTEVCVRLWPRPGREQEAVQALQRAVVRLRRAERRLSRFDPRSDLSRINQWAGQPVRVARLTQAVVAEALAAAHATGGLFDPTVLHAVRAAGYDRDFALLAERGAVQLAVPPVQRARFRAVVIDARAGTVCVPEGVGLDLGGIAKGWLADATARYLRRAGAALADLGGDIAVTGPPPGWEAWEVEVADPWDESRALGVLSLRAGGVATSGVLRRRWCTAAGSQHHIIDPRTGRPADTDLVQVTVVAPRAAAAEAAATAALLLGREKAAAVLTLSGCLAGVLVDVDGGVTSVGFSNRERWVTWHPSEA